MGEIDTAVKYSKQIETLLEQKFGASGKGLHEKLSSIETKIAQNIARQIRYVASIRNKVVHENGYQIDDYDQFVFACEKIIQSLNSLAADSISASGTALEPPHPQLNTGRYIYRFSLINFVGSIIVVALWIYILTDKQRIAAWEAWINSFEGWGRYVIFALHLVVSLWAVSYLQVLLLQIVFWPFQLVRDLYHRFMK